MKMPMFARKLMHFRGGDTPWDSLGSLLRLPDGHATFQTCVDRESFDVPAEAAAGVARVGPCWRRSVSLRLHSQRTTRRNSLRNRIRPWGKPVVH